jgi:hypothetical protein
MKRLLVIVLLVVVSCSKPNVTNVTNVTYDTTIIKRDSIIRQDTTITVKDTSNLYILSIHYKNYTWYMDSVGYGHYTVNYSGGSVYFLSATYGNMNYYGYSYSNNVITIHVQKFSAYSSDTGTVNFLVEK